MSFEKSVALLNKGNMSHNLHLFYVLMMLHSSLYYRSRYKLTLFNHLQLFLVDVCKVLSVVWSGAGGGIRLWSRCSVNGFWEELKPPGEAIPVPSPVPACPPREGDLCRTVFLHGVCEIWPWRRAVYITLSHLSLIHNCTRSLRGEGRGGEGCGGRGARGDDLC